MILVHTGVPFLVVCIRIITAGILMNALSSYGMQHAVENTNQLAIAVVEPVEQSQSWIIRCNEICSLLKHKSELAHHYKALQTVLTTQEAMSAVGRIKYLLEELEKSVILVLSPDALYTQQLRALITTVHTALGNTGSAASSSTYQMDNHALVALHLDVLIKQLPPKKTYTQALTSAYAAFIASNDTVTGENLYQAVVTLQKQALAEPLLRARSIVRPANKIKQLLEKITIARAQQQLQQIDNSYNG